jgi:MinD-like ATPase involved in chromosome partitioning or flagellar assembly
MATRERGSVIAVCGGQGGCGTSEVAALLARALAAAGGTVAAVDAAEGEGALGMLLGLDPEAPGERMAAWAQAVADGPVGHPAVIDHMLTPTSSGVHLARGAAGLRWSLGEPALLGRIAQSLAAVREWVVLDTPALPTAAAVGAWRAAGTLVLVTGPKPQDLYRAHQTLTALAAEGVRVGGVLVDCAHGEPAPDGGEISSALDVPLLGVVPWDRALASGSGPRLLDGPFGRAVRRGLAALAPAIAPESRAWWHPRRDPA